MNKKTRKKCVALLTILAMVICTIFCSNTAKADTENLWDISEVQKVSKCTINGIERTLTLLKNGKLYFEIKETEYLEEITSDITDAGFDKNYGTVYCIVSGKSVRWWNYDLIPNYPVLDSIYKDMKNKEDYIGNIEQLLFDENGEFVLGYKTITGETYPTLTMSEMKAFLEIPDDPSPTPATPSPSPSAPVASPDNSTPSTIPTSNPSITSPTNSVTPTPAVAKKSVKKKAGYSCLSVGSKVTSKYKLTKGKLTWKGNGKSKKFSGVKSAGFIKKSGNLVFMTKQGKVYTLSSKGKKKCIVKKKAKKLIVKNKFVVKVKVGKKFINLANK